MVEWVATLKALLKGDAGIHITQKTDVTSIPNNRKQVIKGKSKSGTVNIVNNYIQIGEATPENIKIAKELLLPEFEKGNTVFLSKPEEELVSETLSFEERQDIKEIIDFFAGKIPPNDWNILRTGLYMKHLMEQGEKTQNLKLAVMNQWGQRGNNIVNLASAGYFESEIRELYEQVHTEGNAFSEEYERIVTQLPRSIFVNRGLGVEELAEKIMMKLDTNAKYGVENPSIRVHGFGPNIATIEKALQLLEGKVLLVDSRIYTRGKLQLMDVELGLNSES